MAGILADAAARAVPAGNDELFDLELARGHESVGAAGVGRAFQAKYGAEAESPPRRIFSFQTPSTHDVTNLIAKRTLESRPKLAAACFLINCG
jgi:hypothetical protein